MSLNSCSTHAILAIMSYVAFIAAAAGGGTYLFVEWYRPLKELENFRSEMQSVRLRTNLVYMGIGIAMLGLGLVTGSLRAEALWGSYWSWDAKQVVTVVVLVYYIVAAALLVAFYTYRNPRMAVISSALTIGGIPLLLLNGLIINFFVTALHKF